MLFGKTIVVTGISSGIGARIGELAQALGADVIGVDINEPTRPLDAFIKADIGSAAGRGRDRPRRCRSGSTRLCNVAGVSGMIGAAKTLAINFYGLRELSEAVAPRLREGGAVVNVASIAGYGWRANLERAKAFVAAPGLSRSQRRSSPRTRCRTPRPIRCPRSFCCCGRCGPRIEPLFKDRGVRVNAVSPGPVTTPILKEFRSIFGDPRVDDDIARVGRAGSAPDIAPRGALPLLGRRALDQRRQPAGRRRPRSLDQCECSRILNRADVPVTGAFASEAAAASEADAVRAVEAAAHAFPAWSETGSGERRAFLLKAAG